MLPWHGREQNCVSSPSCMSAVTSPFVLAFPLAFAFAYLHLHICICIFAFAYLQLHICICIFAFSIAVMHVMYVAHHFAPAQPLHAPSFPWPLFRRSGVACHPHSSQLLSRRHQGSAGTPTQRSRSNLLRESKSRKLLLVVLLVVWNWRLATLWQRGRAKCTTTSIDRDCARAPLGFICRWDFQTRSQPMRGVVSAKQVLSAFPTSFPELENYEWEGWW